MKPGSGPGFISLAGRGVCVDAEPKATAHFRRRPGRACATRFLRGLAAGVEPTHSLPTHPSHDVKTYHQTGGSSRASSVPSVPRFAAEIRRPIDCRTVHQLRHTFATKMLKEGMTLNDVRLLLGQSSIQTTQRYQHPESSDVLPRAVEILNRQNVARNRAKIKVVGGGDVSQPRDVRSSDRTRRVYRFVL